MEERKVATILFADLAGSTAMADRQDPERTRVLLDRFSKAMSAEVEAAGGTAEKFAGDAVMAVFGAPAAYEDHAERALHAALSMHRRIAEVFDGRIELHIGVNTGEVVFGDASEGSYVSGDAVNVAARLEQAAAPGEVLVGERTAAAAGGAFEFGDLVTVEAKGKPGGVRCRLLLRALARTRPRGRSGLGPAFIGRTEELERLLSASRASVDRGRPRLVTIIGDAGIGKSRLILEMLDRLAAEQPAPVAYAGRCLAYGRAITYSPLGEILRAHLGLSESDPPDDVERRLGDDRILGLTLGLDTAGDLHPLAARDALHEAWIKFFGRLVEDRPAVLLIEDVHWAEPPLLDLMEELARSVDGPLLLVATGRPDFVDARMGWGAGRYDAETIWLEQLPTDAAGAMLESLLGASLPTEARERIVARSEGNPLFIEELLGSLIDQGFIEHAGDESEDEPDRPDVAGGWRIRDLPADLLIPDTVQAVVASRLDLLPPAEKAALQAASVAGRVFWTGPVYDLVEDEPDLRVLEDRDFIRRHPASTLEGEREFVFKHAITREVAYASLPKANRARLHAAFAEWIEGRIGGRDELASLLAHHYAAAVDPDVADLAWADDPERLDVLSREALRWLRRAGDLAMSRYELPDAITLFEQALELHPERDEEVELWRSVGQANALRYDGAGLADAMQHAIDLCTDPLVLGELYAELAVEAATRSGMWAHLPEVDLVPTWIDRALELAPAGTAPRARALIAVSFWNPERPEWAVRELDGLTRELGDPWLRMQALMAAWLREFREGRFVEGLDLVLDAFALERDISDPNVRAELREASVTLFTLCGRIPDVRRLIAEYDEASARLSPHHRMHGVAMAIELEEITGDWEAIRAMAPRTRAYAADNRTTPCVRNRRSLLACAAACAELGDDEESRALEAESAGYMSERYEQILAAPRVRLALGRHDMEATRTLVAEPQFDRGSMWWYPGAVTAYLDALTALQDRDRVERDAPQFLGSRSVLEPFALRSLGVVREDPSLLAQAVEAFERMGFERQAADTRAF